MTSRVVGIVGDGPRLTYVLNAMSLIRRELTDLQVVVVHASAHPGAGWVHDPTLPAEFVMNRQRQDISFGPDPTCRGWEGSAVATVTLEDWLARQGLMAAPSHDFPGRAIHGTALRGVLDEALTTLGAQVSVRFVRGFVESVSRSPKGELELRGGFPTEVVDECLLLTGHGERPEFYRALDGQDLLGGDGSVVGGGASGLDLAISLANRLSPGDRPVRHISRSGLVAWPRPRRNTSIPLPSLRTPFLDEIESERNVETSDLIGSVAAEILHVHGQLSGAAEAGKQWGSAVRQVIGRSSAVGGSLFEQLRLGPGGSEMADHLTAAPWSALDLLVGFQPQASPGEAAARLAAADAGYGSDPAVTAVEHVLRDHRPRLCQLAASGRVSDRSAAFSALVGAMNVLVNGPAPETARTYLRLRREGKIEVGTEPDGNASDLVARVPSLGSATGRDPLSQCLAAGVARVGVTFMVGAAVHTRVSVDSDMALDGPNSDGDVFAIGPNVDSGELLHASAMRPGCDHTVMYEITRWLGGLIPRTQNHRASRSARA